jgi:aconitate decarboxylase
MASAQVEDETLQLATFLSQLTYEDLPPEVIEHAKRAILNILGCALGSANASPRRKALAALLPSEPVERASGAVTIWGRPERTNLDDGAILNGIAATTYGRFLGGKWSEHENRKSEIRKSENRKSIIC